MTKGTIDAASVKAEALVLVRDLHSSLDRLSEVLQDDAYRDVGSSDGDQGEGQGGG